MGNAMQVRKLSLELFRVLRPVHQLPAEFSEWLSAAAMLHEVGLYVNRAGRHRHTHYIIAHSEIFGYTEAQRAVISAIARYQGNTKPHESDRIMRRIPVLEQKNVIKAVALLRMAGALDHGNRSAVRGVAGRVNGAVARLRLRVARGGAELELWALEKEFGYFREVFGRELEVALV
jgi:exopolyphosphatase/guanosine-5'-triphosphate,3'-diphosphate pyrophosphatase